MRKNKKITPFRSIPTNQSSAWSITWQGVRIQKRHFLFCSSFGSDRDCESVRHTQLVQVKSAMMKGNDGDDEGEGAKVRTLYFYFFLVKDNNYSPSATAECSAFSPRHTSWRFIVWIKMADHVMPFSWKRIFWINVSMFLLARHECIWNQTMLLCYCTKCMLHYCWLCYFVTVGQVNGHGGAYSPVVFFELSLWTVRVPLRFFHLE